jgi:hypothetical protein
MGLGCGGVGWGWGAIGIFHDQGDAEWIVIRGQLKGNQPQPAYRSIGLSAARGLAPLRAYLVV